jgi:RHS repeat-associated protein
MNSDEPISEADYNGESPGTDGVAVSSYAFDDFGRNVDPRTGKLRKHEYTTNGNIIQPFAFTGYQEDEVSGLKFAQARFYDATTGRFQSNDPLKGNVIIPDSTNPYIYCLNEPLLLVDTNGKSPSSCVEEEQNGYTIMSDGFDVFSILCDIAEGAAKTASKYYEKLIEGTSKIIESLPKLGKRAEPKYNNKVYASILANRSSKYAENAVNASRFAKDASKVGKIFTGVAVVSEVVGGLTSDSSRPLGRKITDAAVDGAYAYANIEVSAFVGAAVTTGVAGLIGGTEKK